MNCDLCQLELVEDPSLPARTLVASLGVVREIRAALGRVDLRILVGEGDSVLISSDLYEAFGEWTARNNEDDAPQPGSAELN